MVKRAFKLYNAVSSKIRLDVKTINTPAPMKQAKPVEEDEYCPYCNIQDDDDTDEMYGDEDEELSSEEYE